MLKVTCQELAEMIGQTIGPSEWMEITQDMVDQYGHAVKDLNWIHVDVDRATKAFGGTIVYGLLTLSLVPALSQTLLDIVDSGADLNYGMDKLRFLSVVHGGDRVRLSIRILGLEPRGEGLLLRSEYVVEVEGRDKPALVADWLFLLFPKEESLARQAGLAIDKAA
ncbi:MAG: MaoC family dehydratase [Sulfuricaulis sp.]|nr:MaoC family dehydratase [Sulfuricaulis sp.]